MYVKTVSYALFAMVMVSCSPAEEKKQQRSSETIYWPNGDVAAEGDGMWYSMDPGDSDMAGSGKWDNRFFLNFDGGTVTADDSFIVQQSGLTEQVIPAFAAADIGSTKEVAELKTTVKDLVAGLFQGVDVEIFVSKPEPPYSTLYVGGKNFTGRANTLGVAPLDLGNFSGTDILYAFSQEFSDKDEGQGLSLLVHTIAHEMAHSLGARHIVNNAAVMNPTVGLASNDFNEDGDYTTGDGSENSFTLLTMNVGGSNATAPEDRLPQIEDIDIKSEGQIAQYSVFSLANITGNKDLKLGDYNYVWEMGSLTAEGPVIRIRFRDSEPKELKLTVSHPTSGMSQSMMFTVGLIPRT